jgi:putative thioredoxin
MKHKADHPNIIDVHLADFEEKVLMHSYTIPVLVDFWADWCGPCHAIAPNLIKAVEEENGRILLAKLEVDEGENMKLAGRYNVRGFPTIMLFQNGRNVAHFTSARPMHFIREFIHQHLMT